MIYINGLTGIKRLDGVLILGERGLFVLREDELTGFLILPPDKVEGFNNMITHMISHTHTHGSAPPQRSNGATWWTMVSTAPESRALLQHFRKHLNQNSQLNNVHWSTLVIFFPTFALCASNLVSSITSRWVFLLYITRNKCLRTKRH